MPYSREEILAELQSRSPYSREEILKELESRKQIAAAQQQFPIAGRLGAATMGGLQTLANIPVTLGQALTKRTQELQQYMTPKTRQMMQQAPGAAAMAQAPTPYTFAQKSLVGRAFPGAARAGAAIAPFFTPMPEVKGLAALTRAVPTGIAQRVAMRTPEAAATGAGYGAAFTSPGTTPETTEDKRHSNAAHGAMISLGLTALLQGIPGGIGLFFRNFRKLAREKAAMNLAPTQKVVQPEEALAIADNLKDQPYSLGDITQSPKLQSFYHHWLRAIPFSGIEAKNVELLKNTDKQAIDINNSLLNNAPAPSHQLRQTIADEIKNTANTNKNIKNQNYENLYSLPAAQSIDFKPELTKNYAIKELKDELDARIAGKGKLDNEQLTDLSRILQVPKAKLNQFNIFPVKVGGQDVSAALPEDVRKSLTETALGGQIAQEKLPYRILNRVQNAYEDSKMRSKGEKYNFYKNLAGNYKKDINNAIGKQGNPELINGLKNADEYYSKNFAPYYKEPDIRKILSDNIDTSSANLENTLLNTKHEPVLNAVSPATKERLLRLKLDSDIPDDSEFAAPKMVNAYNNLRTKKELSYAKEKLLTPELEKRFNDLKQRTDLTKVARGNMKQNIINDFYKYNKAAYLLGAGGIYKWMHMGPSFIASAIGLPLAARGMGAALRSQWLKNLALSKQIPYAKGELGKYVPPLTRALIPQFEGQ